MNNWSDNNIISDREYFAQFANGEDLDEQNKLIEDSLGKRMRMIPFIKRFGEGRDKRNRVNFWIIIDEVVSELNIDCAIVVDKFIIHYPQYAKILATQVEP